ncbi:serine hydrolase domain-containing protein [Ekhidna sp.]|uniref:serine hydrolase domain-containing protein n=1 Tax=Ekhidna sp. TaxID=2608089 RepID=UPI0032EDB1F8
MSLLTKLTSHSDSEIDLILEEFEWQLQKDLRDDDLKGSISMAIVKEGNLIRSKAFGFHDFKKSQATTDSVYRTGSISKSLVAYLMMLLVQDNTIELDGTIEEYLPEVKKIKGYRETPKITFRLLASHMSGLANEPQVPQKIGSVDNWESLLLEVFPNAYFEARPDEQYIYSNLAFGILGLALTRATNKALPDLLSSKVFEPLSMQNTFYKIPISKKGNIAIGRLGGPIGCYNEEKPLKELAGRGWATSSGGVWSTANDLAKFVISLMGFKSDLKKEYLNIMQTTKSKSTNWEENYGLGLFTYKDSIIHRIGHEGIAPGYRANFAYEKDTKYGVVILRNYTWGSTDLKLRSTLLLRRLKKVQIKNNK